MKVLAFLILITSFSAMAEKNYISGLQKVTFRSGPGKENKIIQMIETTSRVELIERGELWSKVKDQNGVEGFVLNRFLTKDIPYNLRYEWLKRKHDKLQDNKASLKDKLSGSNQSVSELNKKLSETELALKNTTTELEELKKGSKEYLSLKSKYEKTLAALNKQTERVSSLKSKVSTTAILWLLAGGGLMLLGWIIGLFSRKKQKYASSVRF